MPDRLSLLAALHLFVVTMSDRRGNGRSMSLLSDNQCVHPSGHVRHLTQVEEVKSSFSCRVSDQIDPCYAVGVCLR